MSTNLSLAIAIFTASHMFAQAADWNRLQTLSAKERVAVTLRDGKLLEGRFRSWSPTALEIVRQQRTESLKFEQVERVRVQRKGSRAKSALIGALVGFAVAFPVGAIPAGYLADTNNPSFGTRVGMGSGFGMFGAGIGAAIGVLAGGSKEVTVYRAGARQ